VQLVLLLPQEELLTVLKRLKVGEARPRFRGGRLATACRSTWSGCPATSPRRTGLA